MDFQTQKAYFNNLPYSASDDVFAASFASYVTQTAANDGYILPSTWSNTSASSLSDILDNSSMDTDSADESTSTPSPSAASSKPTTKSKRAARAKECSESVASRRREQNRANQRAYRKRKEQRIQELQAQLDEMSQRNEALVCSCSLLVKECARLRSSRSSTPAWGMPGLDEDVLAAGAAKGSPSSSYGSYTGSTPDRLWN